MRVKVLNVKSSDEYLEAVVEGEDYTLFAPLLEYLLREEGVVQAMYDMDHPLIRRVTLKIRTRGKPPMEALNAAVTSMTNDLDSIKGQLMDELGGSK